MTEMDLTQEGQELARRRKVQEALLAQAQASAARASSGKGDVLDALGSWLGNRRANSQGAELQASEQAYRQKYEGQLQAGLGKYLDTRNGRAGEVLDAGGADALMNGGQDPGMLRAGIKADPRRAVVEAMTSQLPELQAIGKADFGQLGKQQEIKQHVINGRLVESIPGQAPRVAGDYSQNDDYGPMQTLGTDPSGKPIQGQRNSKTGEFKYAPGGGQTINIGEKGDAAMLEPGMKVLDKARTAILGEQKNLDAAKRIYELSQDPQLISGPGATPLMFLSSVGAKLGFNGPEASAKTQALLTDLAGNALARGQEMKGSFSNQDIEFLKDVTAGKIEASPQVMQQVAALAYASAHNGIMAATQQYSGTANTTEQLKKASAMYPMPAIKHGNLDPSRFTDEEGTGYMKYNSPLTGQAGAKASGRTISLQEFLGGGNATR